MRTIRHIRQEIYTRLGFFNQAAASDNLKVIINSFIDEAQSDIYWLHGFEETRLESIVSTVAGTTLYDWPNKVDPKRRIYVDCKIDNDVWVPLAGPGIDYEHDTYVDAGSSFPIRYDAHSQLEIWPAPDSVYTLRIEHFAKLGYFIEPDAWVANTAYTEGQFVLPTALTNWPNPFLEAVDKNHFVYECTTAGTTHATTEPTWSTTDGGTFTDGTVTWTARLNTSTMPDDLIFRLALYKAKLHYRQPDAESSLNAFNNLLVKQKAGDTTGRRYIKKRRKDGLGNRQDPPWIPPKRV